MELRLGLGLCLGLFLPILIAVASIHYGENDFHLNFLHLSLLLIIAMGCGWVLSSSLQSMIRRKRAAGDEADKSSASASNGLEASRKKPMDGDEDLHSRQLFKSNILVSGMQGLGVEIDQESNTSTTLFPSQHCKTLHLVRHAQGIHNVDGEKNHDAYMSPAFFDAHLTPLGWEQVGNLHKHVQECGLSRRIDLVIVSPLLRTIQTAVGVFGGEDYVDGVDVPPLMIANAGNSEHPAISSSNCPPFLAVETCRERLGAHPCDKRRSITEYRPLFPAIDFSLIESDEDILWTAEKREAREEVAARGMRFFNWLWTRKEKEIAIVTHSGFLFDTLEGFGNDCHPSVKQEISKQ